MSDAINAVVFVFTNEFLLKKQDKQKTFFTVKKVFDDNKLKYQKSSSQSLSVK